MSSRQYISRRKDLFLAEFAAYKAAHDAEMDRLGRDLARVQGQLDVLMRQPAPSVEDDELKTLGREEKTLKIKKLKSDLRWRFVVIPLTIVGGALKLFAPVDAATVPPTTSNPVQEVQRGPSRTQAAIPISALRTDPLSEPSWISGTFHKKFRPFVDSVEKIYRALETQENLRHLVEELAKIAESMDEGDAEALNAATAFVVKELRSREIHRASSALGTGDLLSQSRPNYFKWPKLLKPFVYPPLTNEPSAAIREAAKLRLSGVDGTLLKNGLNSISEEYLRSESNQKMLQSSKVQPEAESRD